MEQVVNLLCAAGGLMSFLGCGGRAFLSVHGKQKHSKADLSVGLFLHSLLAGGLPGTLALACRPVPHRLPGTGT